METLYKVFILFGIIFLVFGIILFFASKFQFPFLGKMPGDIHIQKEKFTIYFPITTCIIISLLLSLVFYLLKK